MNAVSVRRGYVCGWTVQCDDCRHLWVSLEWPSAIALANLHARNCGT